MKNFRDFKPEERRNYITLSTGEYYPDILEDACRLYAPVLETFSRLLHSSESSSALFTNIASTPNQWMRTQLCRVFRKYVSPETPVEMLKRARKLNKSVMNLVMDFVQYQLFKKDLMHAPSLMKHYVLYYGNIRIGVKKGMILQKNSLI